MEDAAYVSCICRGEIKKGGKRQKHGIGEEAGKKSRPSHPKNSPLKSARSLEVPHQEGNTWTISNNGRRPRHPDGAIRSTPGGEGTCARKRTRAEKKSFGKACGEEESLQRSYRSTKPGRTKTLFWQLSKGGGIWKIRKEGNGQQASLVRTGEGREGGPPISS